MFYPPISCKCITYGRIETLEESVYSFINQKYKGKKELIIVNDYPKQKIFFNHKDVKIYNMDFTFDCIGRKENYALSKCNYDIIAVWDDDDIGLSNHLDNIVKFFTDDFDLLIWKKGIFYNDGAIAGILNISNSGMVYRKSKLKKAGGVPILNAGYDIELVHRLRSVNSQYLEAAPIDSELSWIYYWGNRSYHMSGQGLDSNNEENIIQRHKQYIESERLKGNIPTGHIRLEPKWKLDYEKQLREYINKSNS